MPQSKTQATKRHSPHALHSKQNGMLSAHTLLCDYPSYWGKFYRAVNTKSLHFIEITNKLILIKISAKIFFERRDMKSLKVLDREGDDNQITSWCWDMTCRSLGSFSAGRQGPAEPTTTRSAEVSAHRFQGSAQSSGFCGKIQIWACQWGNQPPLSHPAGTPALLGVHLLLLLSPSPSRREGEHSREANTGRCCLNVGLPGKHHLP